MADTPLILGFDSSGPYCGVALFSGDDVIAAQYVDMLKGQAERLLPMIEDVLAEAGVAMTDLSALGVGIGPGNFTGIRISVAAARGLALALGIPAIGVSLFDALREGHDGPTLCTLDARRDQLYVQRVADGADRGPELVAFADVDTSWAHPALICLGNRAVEVAAAIDATSAPARFAPASAIARIAARRYDQPHPRPAPLYIRAADAAPARDQGPVLL